MRKAICLLFVVLLAGPALVARSGAVERSLGNMNVPMPRGVDTLGLGVPTVVQRSLAQPNVPVVLGLDASLIHMMPRDHIDLTLTRPVQYNCKRDCNICRESCAIRWKGQCQGPGCRPGFSDCMKACWNDFCRYCR